MGVGMAVEKRGHVLFAFLDLRNQGLEYVEVGDDDQSAGIGGGAGGPFGCMFKVFIQDRNRSFVVVADRPKRGMSESSAEIVLLIPQVMRAFRVVLVGVVAMAVEAVLAWSVEAQSIPAKLGQSSTVEDSFSM